MDNASTDGTGEALEALIEEGRILYHRMDRNLGGAGGFNFAVKKAAEDSDYIWIMDDDTYPEPAALQAFVDHIKELDDSFGYMSSLAKWRDGSACIMNKQNISGDFFERMDLLEAGLIPVRSASFVSLFIKTDMVKELGLPISEFFLWGDDTEYTMRLNKYGGHLAIDSIVLHDMDANDPVDILDIPESRLDRYALFVRNRIYISKKYGSTAEVIAAFLSPIKQIFRVTIFLKGHKLAAIRCLLKGFFDGFSFAPEIEYP